MIPICIEGANKHFVKPASMTDDECHTLSVRVEPVFIDSGETIQCLSAWQPTPDELKRLNNGAAVILTVIGGQPPVALAVGPERPL